MNRKYIKLWSLLSVLFCLGCSQPQQSNNNNDNKPPLRKIENEPKLKSYVRVIFIGKHAGISVKVNGISTAVIQEKQQDTGFLTLEAGERLISVEDSASKSLLAANKSVLKAEHHYTFYLVNSSKGLVTRWEETKASDNTNAPKIRVLHAVTGFEEMDLWTTSDKYTKNRLLISRLAFRDFSDYYTMPALDKALALTLSGKTQTVAQIWPTELKNGQQYTLILTGSLDNRNTEQSIQTQLFSETSKGLNAEQIPTQTEMFLNARVRVHHTATLGNRSVRVTLDDRIYVIRLDPGKQSVSFAAPMGKSRLKVEDIKTNEILVDQEVFFTEKSRYSLFLVQSEDEFDKNEKYQLRTLKESRLEPNISSTMAKIQWFNAVKDYKEITIKLQQGSFKSIAQTDNLQFNQRSEMTAVKPGIYPITAIVPGFEGLEVQFGTIELKAGTLTTLILTQTDTGKSIRYADSVKQYLSVQAHQQTETAESTKQVQATDARYIASVSFVQASSKLGIISNRLGIFLNTTLLETLSDVSQYTGYFLTQFGQKTIKFTDARTGEILVQKNVTLDKNTKYTAYLHDSKDNNYNLWFVEDVRPELKPNQTLIRLIHVAPKTDELTLLSQGIATDVIEDQVKYQQAMAFKTLTAGKTELLIRNKSNLTIWSKVMSLEAGRSYTVLVRNPSQDQGNNYAIKVTVQEHGTE